MPALPQLPPAQRARVEQAITRARDAVSMHQHWLERELLPNANGDFRIGRELFDQKLGFALMSFRVLEHPSPRHLRLALLLLAVYLWPLAAAILVIHLDRFDSGALITYAFFVIVGIMSIATAWYLLRQPPVDLAPPIDEEGPAPSTRGLA